MSKRVALSKSEEGIYVSSLNGGDAYNLGNTINLGKDYSPEQIKEALDKVATAHPSLFTILSIDDEGNIYKEIRPQKLDVPVKEVSELKIESLPYELLDKPLYRFVIYKVKGDIVLYFDFHHIIMDGTSLKVFIDDFYSALENKELETEKSDVYDYTTEENKVRSSEVYQEDKNYYDQLLSGVETDSTLVEDKVDDKVSYGNIRTKLKISNEQVKKVTSKLGIKTSTYFLGAFSYLLSKINMENEALFLTVNNSRTKDVLRSFGCYVKTYPLYITYQDEDSVSELLKRVNEQNINNVKHNSYSFMELSKDLGISYLLIKATISMKAHLTVKK